MKLFSKKVLIVLLTLGMFLFLIFCAFIAWFLSHTGFFQSEKTYSPDFKQAHKEFGWLPTPSSAWMCQGFDFKNAAQQGGC